MSAPIQERLDRVLDRATKLGATPRPIAQNTDTGSAAHQYRDVPISRAQIGGSRVLGADRMPITSTTFGV